MITANYIEKLRPIASIDFQHCPTEFKHKDSSKKDRIR